MVGNGSYILRPCGHDHHSPNIPFSLLKMSQYWLVLKITKFAFTSTDSMKSLRKNMGTSLYCETGVPSSGHSDDLDLRTHSKSMYNIYTVAGLLAWWSRSVTFRRLCHSIYGRVPGVRYSLGGQSVALWEDVFQKKLLPFDCSMRWAFLLGLSWSFQTVFFKAWKLSHSGCLWLTVWLLWTAAGDTIGLFQSSTCLSGRGHCSWEGVQVLKSSWSGYCIGACSLLWAFLLAQ